MPITCFSTVTLHIYFTCSNKCLTVADAEQPQEHQSPPATSTVDGLRDKLFLSDFTVFDWNRAVPTGNLRLKQTCAIVGSGVCSINGGQLQLRDIAFAPCRRISAGDASNTLLLPVRGLWLYLVCSGILWRVLNFPSTLAGAFVPYKTFRSSGSLTPAGRITS